MQLLKKNLCMSGSMQFKLMLLKGPLYYEITLKAYIFWLQKFKKQYEGTFTNKIIFSNLTILIAIFIFLPWNVIFDM